MTQMLHNGKIIMHCPIKARLKYDSVDFGECEYSKCAWWNYQAEECSVTSIGLIGFMLDKMNQNMKGDKQ